LKRRFSHIAIPLLLIANLLFSQAVVNLLHDPHNFHQPVTQLQKAGKTTIQQHQEHCKVCSLDIVLTFVTHPAVYFQFSIQQTAPLFYVYSNVAQTLVSSCKDRAPPVIS
jgi:hypothetical protein